jgi:hypothetical protein
VNPRGFSNFVWAEAEVSYHRPVPVIAGHYREYLRFVEASRLRDQVDVRYFSRAEFLHGLPFESLVVLTGSYASRPDWPAIKGALDAFRAETMTLDLDGVPYF